MFESSKSVPLLKHASHQKHSSAWRVGGLCACFLLLFVASHYHFNNSNELAVSEEFAVKAGEAGGDISYAKLHIECIYWDNPQHVGENRMQTLCDTIARDCLGGCDLRKYHTSEAAQKLREPQTAKKFLIYFAVHGSDPYIEGTNQMAKTAKDHGRGKDLDGLLSLDFTYAQVIDLITAFRANHPNTMVATNACHSTYLINDRRYIANPFPIITMAQYHSGVNSVNLGLTEMNSVADIVTNKIGLNAALIQVLANNPNTFKAMKENLRKMVNRQPQQSLLFDTGYLDNTQEITRSWLFTSPTPPGTAFSEYSLAPLYFYLMEWIQEANICNAAYVTRVGKGATADPGPLRYRITRRINGFNILGITDPPVIDVQTFVLQGDKAVLLAKKEMVPNQSADGFVPATGTVTFDIPEDACSDQVVAFKFKYEWHIEKILGQKVMDIVRVAKESQEMLEEKVRQMQARMDALTRTSSLAGVIAEDESMPLSVQNMAKAAAASVKANKDIHNAFSNMAAEAMEMEGDEEEGAPEEH